MHIFLTSFKNATTSTILQSCIKKAGAEKKPSRFLSRGLSFPLEPQLALIEKTVHSLWRWLHLSLNRQACIRTPFLPRAIIKSNITVSSQVQGKEAQRSRDAHSAVGDDTLFWDSAGPCPPKYLPIRGKALSLWTRIPLLNTSWYHNRTALMTRQAFTHQRRNNYP